MASPQEKKVLERESRKRLRLQLLLYALDEWFEGSETTSMRMNQVVIRNGRDRGGEVLVILKASEDDRAYVAFHSGETAEGALRGALEKVRNESTKWREETPYKATKE